RGASNRTTPNRTRRPSATCANRRALLDDLAHACVASNRPLDFNWPSGHSAALLKRFRRDLGPKHEAIRRGITGSYSERKRIGRKHRRAPELAAKQAARRGHQRACPKPAQDHATVDGGKVVNAKGLVESVGHGRAPLQSGIEDIIIQVTRG